MPTYAEIALEYQRILIQDLDRIMERHGIDLKTRRSICLSYAFQTGTLRDGARLEVNGVELSPEVVFKLLSGAEIQNTEKLYFHDNASNSVFSYFDAQEGL
ncbi:hypothetical protein ACFPTX_13700 [Pseudomonas sp. GCM10022188]|uniref:hypothetical protein n=1 Tax=Pseudomonas TaxID=286 RepID=UPI001E3BAFBF|nr:hypothetical protein [Pseudomonas oryzagri]MCC6074342.1 hypothetical protein [Pseudomonas oryzagri]